MKTTMIKSKLKYLRVLPLLACGLVAVGMCAHLCLDALEAVVVATGGVLLSCLWIGGPFVLAVCLAALARGQVERVVFDLALVGMVLMEVAALVLCVLPFVEVWEVFRYLPLLQFGGLTGLLVLVMAGRLGWPVLVGAWKKRRGVEGARETEIFG